MGNFLDFLGPSWPAKCFFSKISFCHFSYLIKNHRSNSENLPCECINKRADGWMEPNTKETSAGTSLKKEWQRSRVMEIHANEYCITTSLAFPCVHIAKAILLVPWNHMRTYLSNKYLMQTIIMAITGTFHNS